MSFEAQPIACDCDPEVRWLLSTPGAMFRWPSSAHYGNYALHAVAACQAAMKGRSLAVLGLVLALALLPVARAGPAAIAQTEINYLLGFIETSGCEFYRNGSWYDSKKAQAHLRYKYQMLAAKDQIKTAEDFIAKAATQSSLSGRPYQVRCSGGQAVASSQWLREVLARYRGHSSLRAPPAARGGWINASGSRRSLSAMDGSPQTAAVSAGFLYQALRFSPPRAGSEKLSSPVSI